MISRRSLAPTTPFSDFPHSLTFLKGQKSKQKTIVRCSPKGYNGSLRLRCFCNNANSFSVRHSFSEGGNLTQSKPFRLQGNLNNAKPGRAGNFRIAYSVRRSFSKGEPSSFLVTSAKTNTSCKYYGERPPHMMLRNAL
jgi:hypothetical protein